MPRKGEKCTDAFIKENLIHSKHKGVQICLLKQKILIKTINQNIDQNYMPYLTYARLNLYLDPLPVYGIRVLKLFERNQIA